MSRAGGSCRLDSPATGTKSHANWVSGDLLVCYEEGNPRKSVTPDVFVVIGAPRHNRMTYKLWEEPKAPDFVLEVASRNTAARRAAEARIAELEARLAAAKSGDAR